MKINNEQVKRLGIYFFYEKEGIVDSYVRYFFKDYVKQVTDMIVVCNGQLNEEGHKFFEQYTKSVIVRENKGLDVWAYKTAMESLGWEKLVQYDEICFVNCTIMGPVYTLKETFEAMSKENLDFRGMTKHYKNEYDPFHNNRYGYLPEHIQSHFMVFRQSLVKSEDFQSFWDEMPMIKGYEDSIGNFESIFTKHFADLGYKWDVYVKTDDISNKTDYPLMNYAKELIRDKRCPIFKRRMFFQPYEYEIFNTLGQPGKELYDYLKSTGLYDVNLIWDNILRTCHQADFVKNLHLNYILSSSSYDQNKMDEILKKRKLALVMHLYFPDLVEDSFQWASNVPKETDVYITTDTVEKKEAILKVFKNLPCNHLEVRVIVNRGRDVSSILVGVKDVIQNYDYACFVHDKKTAQAKPGSVGDSFGYKCWNNTLYNKEFVCNVLQTFEDNERLGILSPPEPNHGPFYQTLGNEWGCNFEKSREVADKLGITIPMSEDKEALAPYGTFFWFRPTALKVLFDHDWQYEEFPEEPNNFDGTILHAIERLYPICVQQAGYYPGLLMSDQYAAIEVTNLRYYVRELNRVMIDKGYMEYGLFNMVLQRLKQGAKQVIALDGPSCMKFDSKMRKILPKWLYKFLIKIKRAIFGPHGLKDPD